MIDIVNALRARNEFVAHTAADEIEALRAELATLKQAQGEPVGVFHEDDLPYGLGKAILIPHTGPKLKHGDLLYTSAPTIPEGENEAVRMFLMYYGGNSGVTIDGMRENMAMAGFDGHWPVWVSGSDGHLTKSGAQDWIKHLLLSAAPKPGNQT